MIKNANRINQLPTYVPGKPIEELKRELGIENPIKLASNENPLGPSPLALKKMQSIIKNVALYPDGDSYSLKRKICMIENVLPNQIIIGNGSNEVLELIAHSYLNKDDEAIMGEYCFIVYPIVTTLSEGKIIRSKMPDLTHSVDNILALITEKTKIIFIANPNNPTGTMISIDEIERLLEGVKSNILVVIDEAYCEYVKENQRLNVESMVNKWSNLVILKTFSKIYGLAGLRIGYGISNDKIISNIQKAREPFNVNLVAQEAAEAALDDKEHIKNSLDLNNIGILFLKNELTKMGIKTYPSYANFLLIDFGKPSKNIYEELLKKGVIVRQLDNYGLLNCLRVTVGKENENKFFINSLKEVLNISR